ncbi:MAG: PAS domain S-box protein [Bacteroidetes bacterium]|nr:MAG: PAS domain S-box protein [Bacteroidota bacterium]
MELSAENYNILFPFYIELDREFQLSRVGPSMQKIIQINRPTPFCEVFQIDRPKLSISASFDSFLNHLDTLVIISHIEKKIRFRGQLIYHEHIDRIHFIGSPWLNNISELQTFELHFSDFAIQDSITDNLQLLRSKEIVNNEMIQLNQTLIAQRDELLSKNLIIQQTEKKYKTLVEFSNDLIYRVNSSGKFTYINPIGEKITGYKNSELIGQHFTILLNEVYARKLVNFYLFQQKENLDTTYIEFPFVRKDGLEVWLGQSVNLVKTESGEREFIALARNIDEQKKNEKALIRSEEKYKGIIENMKLGFLEVDSQDLIIRAYPRFCDLVGYTEDELIGKNSIELLLDREQQIIMNEQNAQRQAGESSVYEIQLTRKDGEKIWVLISGAPYYDLEDNYIGSFGIHLDITERKIMEEELKKAKLEAEASLRAKEQFLANMSHEIRTPLNAMMGMSELLLQSKINPLQLKYLEAIKSSSESLLGIVNDILNFSKLEAGKLELKLLPTDLKKVLRQQVDLFQLKADQKEIELKLNIELPENTHYLCDQLRLGEIISNLMGNAIKFTMEGSVSLNCQLIASNLESDSLRFEVIDTGVGIPKEKLDQIFDEFSQAHNSSDTVFGGTGLGLAISKSLTELFGGSLLVISREKEGSTFYFEISLTRCSPLEQTEESISDFSECSFPNARILVVDDNELNRFLCQTILDQWDCNSHFATNGEEAIEMLKKEDFDLVLMDIQMPVLNGIDATKYIRQELNKETIIIALTANTFESDLKLYSEAGMNGTLSKPFKQHDLFKTLQTHLVPLQKTSEPKPEIDKATYHHLVNLSPLRKTLGENEQIMKKMLVMFCKNANEDLQVMKTAMVEADVPHIKSIAHKMKASLSLLSHEDLVQLCKCIELDEMELDHLREAVQNFTRQVGELISQIEKIILEEFSK